MANYQRGVRGHGLKAIAKAHQLPRATIQHVLARAEQMGGDPIAPRGHKKRKLEGEEEAKLWRALDRNPLPQTEIWRLLLATKFQNAG